jgi:proteasome lid subunit RPN8/RPN11
VLSRQRNAPKVIYYSMTLIINNKQLQTIFDCAEAIYPEECCGILLGNRAELTKTVVEVIPTINDWQQLEPSTDRIERTKTSRYTIAPQDIFCAQKRGRDLELEIVGFFHSHPDNPAMPSTCDRDLAWEVYSYPIVSLIQGRVGDLKSWVLNSEGIFEQEEIHQI